jgi:glycosyltransferase involved in cell wall biosynthesis
MENKMNIAIISTSDLDGGAAIAAHRLFQGLRQLNQEAVMLVGAKKSSDPQIFKIAPQDALYEIERRIFQDIQAKEIDRNRSELSNTRFSFPYPGYDISKTPPIEAADVINLHWLAQFQSVETIAHLLDTGKPVVWTLHDENAYTGGCHYTAGCSKYRTDCYDCPQLKENSYQVPFYVLQNKLKLWSKSLTIVTPSRWLAECAGKSRLFQNTRIEVIPNSVETDIFKPEEKIYAKKRLGIPARAVTLLFGAYTGSEKRKGFAELIAALRYCLQDERFKNLVRKKDIRILTYGPVQENLAELPIDFISTGYTGDKDRLARVYRAADIFVLPSLEDNLPNTMVEAMACGVPVIGFAVGGVPDMVQNGVTGYTAPASDVKKLAELILRLVFDENERSHIGRNCRRLIEEKFTLRCQAGNYLSLFHDLLKRKSASKSKANGASKRLDERTYQKIGEEITLTEWRSEFQENLFALYRKHTLEILAPQIGKIDEQIQRIYNSYTYKIGNVIISPLRKIKRFFKKH